VPKRKMPEPDPDAFERVARELACDETGVEFERALARVLPPRRPAEPAPRLAEQPVSQGSRRKRRQPDEPTGPHTEEFDDPVEREKAATRKADERARRTKQPGASGIRGGTSKD
jgi:hypothetical protein